jgi:hypothetical protein
VTSPGRCTIDSMLGTGLGAEADEKELLGVIQRRLEGEVSPLEGCVIGRLGEIASMDVDAMIMV